jgi:hypothetical protein
MKKEIQNVAIIGGDYQSIDLLSQNIYDIICPLKIDIIRILYSDESNLGYIWAKENGMPVKKIFAHSPSKLRRRLLYYEADYIFFILHDEQWIKNMIMEYRMTGKHGTVIKTPYAAARSFIYTETSAAALSPLPNWLPPDDYTEDYYKEIFRWN